MIEYVARAVLFLLVVSLHQAEDASNYHLKEFARNGDALSITSFIFNVRAKRPPLWVDRLLGSNAVYWRDQHFLSETLDRNTEDQALKRAHSQFMDLSRNFTISQSAFNPSCYVEMLAFARLGDTYPFHMNESRKSGPAVGYGTLLIPVSASASSNERYDEVYQIRCYYRGVYSNQRQFDFADTFWAVLVYCPTATTEGVCKTLKGLYDENPRSVHLRLMLTPNPEKWTIDMVTYRDDSHPSAEKKPLEQKLAVCTAWPYATLYEDKVRANQALIYEFLRYYSMLGIKLMVYDRDGLNMNGMLKSDYARANPESGQYIGSIARHLSYFNYTVVSSLLPGYGTGRSDTEGEAYDAVAHMDNDKSLTYDHCRFELKARYGITRAIVIDFDEFLYCKAAAPTAEAQSKYIHNYLGKLEYDGWDQISFGKTTIASKVYGTGTVHDCIEKELTLNSARLAAFDAGKDWSWRKSLKSNSTVANNFVYRDKFIRSMLKNNDDKQLSLALDYIGGPGSVFNCFGSVKFIEDYPNIKSIHMNHGCPQTSMHHCCTTCKIEITNKCIYIYSKYDCLCHSQRLFTCDFLHLSLVEEKYDAEDQFDRQQVQSFQSELYFVVNKKNFAK